MWNILVPAAIVIVILIITVGLLKSDKDKPKSPKEILMEQERKIRW